MQVRDEINSVELIDSRPFGRFQFKVFILCALCMILDGFDIQIMGYIAPSLLSEWGVEKSALTPVFSAGLFGMLLGSTGLGMISDRFGRRPVLIGSMLWIGLCMLVTPHVQSVEQLMVLRLLTGIGMGAVVPNAVALGGEYSPKRARAAIMMSITCGYLLGAVLCGLICAVMVPEFGWRSTFYAGGVASIVLSLLMIKSLPESLQFLALNSKHWGRAVAYLQRMVPDQYISNNAVLVSPSPQSQRTSVRELFRSGLLVGTLQIWTIYFMNLLAVFFLASWLPVMLGEAGHSSQQAILAGSMLWGGGIAGTLLLGWAIDRRGFAPVLGGSYIVATIAIAAIGQFLGDLPLALLAIAIAGFCVMAGQAAMNAFSATFYPTHIRATGVGWGLGMGRVGAIVGPVIGGQLMLLGWSSDLLYLMAAIPTLIAAILVLGLQVNRGQNPAAQARTAD